MYPTSSMPWRPIVMGSSKRWDLRVGEYAGAEKLSYTGRIDFHGIEGLRGSCFYQGSTDHGKKGDDAGLGGEVFILSADFEYESGALN